MGIELFPKMRGAKEVLAEHGVAMLFSEDVTTPTY
jgi:hypothetical protein